MRPGGAIEMTSPVSTPSRFERWLAPLAMVAALAALAAGLFAIALNLRAAQRRQIVNQDAEILHAGATLQRELAARENPDAHELDGELLRILDTSRLRGVIAVRVYGLDGEPLIAFPPGVRKTRLDPDIISRARDSGPRSDFYTEGRLGDFFDNRPAGEPASPLLRSWLPLRIGEAGLFLGVVEFVLDGTRTAALLAALDADLWRHGWMTFGVVGGLLCLVMGLALRRLEAGRLLLAERGALLLRANQELAMAARTNALGAVTAHLIHGLRSPLSGLQSFVSAQAQHGDVEWAEAAQSTRRMQGMIAEIVRVLREEEGGVRYELALGEVAELLRSRLATKASAQGVEFRLAHSGARTFSNRDANLIALIVGNLVDNALRAAGSGGKVGVEIAHLEGETRLQVVDTGTGLPEHVQSRLFEAVQTTREGGSGLGLAISKQLANHLGARLELVSTGPNGTVFELAIPVAPAEARGG